MMELKDVVETMPSNKDRFMAIYLKIRACKSSNMLINRNCGKLKRAIPRSKYNLSKKEARDYIIFLELQHLWQEINLIEN